MNRTRPRLSRRAVVGAALGGLAYAAIMPQLTSAAPFLPGQVHAIAFNGDNLILAGDGLWRSDGDGAPSELTSARGAITALATHPERDGRIFAGTEDGRILLSVDGGASWTEAGAGLPGQPITAVAIAAHAPDTVYAAVASDGLWTSKDAGRSWEFAMDRPFQDGTERDLLTLASLNAETGMGGIWIYAGTEAGLTRLPDCFCRWQAVQPGGAMDALAAGEAPPTATPLPQGEPVRSLAAAPEDGALIYAGLPSGIWKSTDAGVNWAKVNGAPTRLIAVDPEDFDHVVAVTGGGLLTSRDGGLSWAGPGA